jgi:Flp pilus assembly protein CpaB
MWHRPARGLDLVTAALIASGAALIAASMVVAAVLLMPVGVVAPITAEPVPVPTDAIGRTSIALPADRVAAVLSVDASAGAGTAARSGDHVDVLGYFSRQVTGAQSVTRLLLRDVAVVTVDRSAGGVALTLAVPQADALLLQEAQALGARPFVMLVAGITQPFGADRPTTFSDADLATRLTGTH